MKNPLEYLKRKKWLIVAAGAALGVFLIVYRPSASADKPKVENDTCEIGYYTERLEEKIADLCRASAGIKDVTVFLTLESGSEYIYAADEKNGGGDSAGSREYLIVSGDSGEEPVRVTEIAPKVRGVAVVCTGGDRADVKERITELLCAALGISSNRIRVSS